MAKDALNLSTSKLDEKPREAVCPERSASDFSSICNLIYTIRGQQVMLDSDLAALYGVETRALNQAVARNPMRFPEHFCFRITKDESDLLKSQIVILGGQTGDAELHWRHLPRVFTEHGVSMLSAVLRSKTAAEVSVRIIEAFIEMRRFFTNNAAMFEQIRSVELRQLEYQKTTDERFERVFDYMNSNEAPKQRIFFSGEIFDAFEFLTGLVQQAERKIVLIDGYVDVGTLNILAKKASGVAVSIWTHSNTSLSQRDVDTFNAQYPLLEIKHTESFHDRFLIIDDEKGYLVGASLKDAGKKSFAVATVEDKKLIMALLERL